MRIVFLGDSITDAGRNTENGSMVSIGQGYALMVQGRLSVKYPGQHVFFNYGVSGNRSVDIYAQIKGRCWNNEPDVVSLLVGVNDVWHELETKNGVDTKRFYTIYRMMVEDTIERFPNVKFILMEPFALDGEVSRRFGDALGNGTKEKAAVVKQIAEEFRLPFVPIQKIMDYACEICPAEYWSPDGVHPSPAGHQLIADAWLDVFEKQIL